MATNNNQTFSAETERTQQIELKAKKSLSYGIFCNNIKENALETAPRSCSANGTSSTDTPFITSLPREKRTAFEDSAGNKKSDAESCANAAHAAEDLRDTITSVEKDDTGEEDEAVSITASQRADKTVAAITPEEHGNKSKVLPSGLVHDALFTARLSASEGPQYMSRDKRKSLILTEIHDSSSSVHQSQETNNMESRVLAAQSSTEMTAKRGDTKGLLTGTNFVEHSVISGAESSLSQGRTLNRNNNKKTVNDREEFPNNTQNKTDEYSEGQSDTIQPLALSPFVQSMADRRRRSSTASLTQFSTTTPSGQSAPFRSRRVSVTGESHFLGPSAFEQTDTTDAFREAALKLQHQRSPTNTEVSGTRRGSQSRRSSVAASMLNSDVRDGKKGSIGFTIAASLVKWKMNTIKAAKENKETIAKNTKQKEFMDRTADRIKTELPRSLMVSIQEAAYPILLRTAQAYRSQLGPKHKLTIQACGRLAELIRDLKSPY